MFQDVSPSSASPAQWHYQTAWSRFSQGRLAEAEREFEQSLALTPDHPLALTGLGIVRFQLGKRDEAISLLRRAAARAPGEAAIANTLGEFLCRSGRFQEALAPLQAAARREPHTAAIFVNLGNAYSGLGRHEEALNAFRRAIAAAPRIREAHNNAGLALSALQRHDEASEQYRQALDCDPAYLEARLNLGISLQAGGRLEEALAAFDAAVAADPRQAAAQVGRGMALRELGRVEEARAAFEKAVAIEPGNPVYQRALADAKKFQPGDPQIAQMEDILRAASLSRENRINLDFALGRAYDDTGRYGEAFARWQEGNALWRGMITYDERAELASLQAVADAYTPEVMQGLEGNGDPSQLPVFIVGMLRSGTTLVEQILASHPQVFGAGEIGDFGLIAAGGYQAERRTSVKLDAATVRSIGERYVANLRALAPQAERIVDKLPTNFLFAGLIHLALPGAKIVHVRRDARDTCLSCYAQMLTPTISYNSDLGELGRFYRAYDRLMAHWGAVMPGALLEIRYEDLVGNFEAEARRLVAFCGLPWDARCLDFHKLARKVQTASAYQVRRPLYTSSIGRWRHYEEWLGPLFEALDGG
jgi:tetratricopeptide (TPR) repeat protein